METFHLPNIVWRIIMLAELLPYILFATGSLCFLAGSLVVIMRMLSGSP